MRKWDKEILEYLNIPECMLPEVKPSSCIYRYTNENLIGGRIPIAGAAGRPAGQPFWTVLL